MGRAIVREPALFLMDEPLSNLDAELRVRIRAEIAALQRRLGTTTIYVTHDQVEAMTLGDRIAVLHGGRLQQVGAPQAVYDHPANVFVASFLGSPGMNLVPPGALGLEDEESGTVGFRPERLVPAAEAGGGAVALALDVDAVEALGNEKIAHGTVAGAPGTRVAARLRNEVEAAGGSRLELAVPDGALHRFDGEGRAIPQKK
jgi:ABC-type sugar transport system ATPase subunit